MNQTSLSLRLSDCPTLLTALGKAASTILVESMRSARGEVRNRQYQWHFVSDSLAHIVMAMAGLLTTDRFLLSALIAAAAVAPPKWSSLFFEAIPTSNKEGNFSRIRNRIGKGASHSHGKEGTLALSLSIAVSVFLRRNSL